MKDPVEYTGLTEVMIRWPIFVDIVKNAKELYEKMMNDSKSAHFQYVS